MFANIYSPESGVNIEKILPLNYIGLFLNRYDITRAFSFVFGNDGLMEIIKEARGSKNFIAMEPAQSYRSLVEEQGEPAFYFNGVISRRIVNFFALEERIRLLREPDVAEKILRNEKGSPILNLENEIRAEDKKARTELEKHEKISKQLYRILNIFFEKVSTKNFREYNNRNYNHFKGLVSNKSTVLQMKGSGLGSALALYWLGHLDARINFLSFFFVYNSIDEVLKDFNYIGTQGSEGARVKQYIKKGIEDGNGLLRLMNLREENFYQPEYYILQLMQNRDNLVKRSMFSAYQELRYQIEKKTEELDSAYLKIAELKKKVSNLNEHPTSTDDLYRKIKELEEKKTSLMSLLTTTKEELKQSEKKLEKAYQLIELIQMYNTKSALVITENPHMIGNLQTIINPIFREIQVISSNDFRGGNNENYDIVIVLGGKKQKYTHVFRNAEIIQLSAEPDNFVPLLRSYVEKQVK